MSSGVKAVPSLRGGVDSKAPSLDELAAKMRKAFCREHCGGNEQLADRLLDLVDASGHLDLRAAPDFLRELGSECGKNMGHVLDAAASAKGASWVDKVSVPGASAKDVLDFIRGGLRWLDWVEDLEVSEPTPELAAQLDGVPAFNGIGARVKVTCITPARPETLTVGPVLDSLAGYLDAPVPLAIAPGPRRSLSGPPLEPAPGSD